MKRMLLTLDYELYGDGSGDVFKHIIEPTQEILNICKRHDVHLTIFFEVVEYWRLKEEWMRGNHMGYSRDPIVAMEKQIQEAYLLGHDVQLHIHPQWVDAYFKDGHWIVNKTEWRLGNYLKGDNKSLTNLFRKGIKTIESLIQPLNPSYRCIAIRAGGYNVQPSKGIVESMKETGLNIDSSIFPGGKENGILSNYDYSNIKPDIGSWNIGDRLEVVGESSILELPIVAFPMIRLKKFFTKERFNGFLRNPQSSAKSLEAKTSTNNKKSSIFDKFIYFFQTEWQTWDYCLFSPSQHKLFLKQIEKQDRDVFVLVGHPKSFSTGRGLEALLNFTPNNKYTYKTFSDIWNGID